MNKNNATASDNRRNVKTRTDREKTRVKAEPTDNAIQNRCLLCSLPAGSVQCFDRHVSCSSGLNRRAMYECRECKYRVSVRRSMMLHLRSHTERKQYSCPRCTYTAPHQRAVNEHRRNVHKGQLVSSVIFPFPSLVNFKDEFRLTDRCSSVSQKNLPQLFLVS